MLQFIVKFAITIGVIVPVFLGLRWLWSQDIDLAKTFSRKRVVDAITQAPSSFVVVRDAATIYQGGEPHGAVVDFSVEAGAVTFKEINQASKLDLQKEFEFRSHILRMETTETVIGMSSSSPEKGTIIMNCRCRIVGQRR